MAPRRKTRFGHPILAATEARWTCDPAMFDFETTESLESPEAFLGQKRALRALSFGAEARSPGYNVFVVGHNGTGRTSMAIQFLEELAATRPTPDDYCYIHNFDQETRPHCIRLPAGLGRKLRQGMDDLVKELAMALPQAFEEEDYERERMALKMQVEQRQSELFDKLRQDGEEQGFAIARTQQGFAVAPVKDGNVMEPSQLAELSEEEQAQLKEGEKTVRNLLRQSLRGFRDIEKEATADLEKMERDNAESVVSHAMLGLRKTFRKLPEVMEYLQEVQLDVLDNVDEFKDDGGDEPEGPMMGGSEGPVPFTHRYKVNLLVDNGKRQGVPVVREDYPTYRNLLGTIEHQTSYGNLVTHLTMICPGSMHAANGGFLVVDAEDLLSNPQAWDGFKRALKVKQLKLEEPFDQLKTQSLVSLRPDPIPLDLKVVLIGTPLLYHLLYTQDPDFPELFKVPAEFRPSMGRSDRSLQAFAGFCAARCKQTGLLSLTRAAVARLCEHSARQAGQQDRLDLRFRDLIDLMSESDFWARKGDDTDGEPPRSIDASHIEMALDQRSDRGRHLQETVLRMIREGTIRLDLRTEPQVGQVNGLTVLQAGQYPFGMPARVSARITAGQGFVVNVEREVQLSGPFHNKGVLILTGYLKGRYGLERPMSVNASVVFEQSYSEVDGDSASLAELCAILSAISDVPLRQDIAMTGSVDQMGRVQAVGGLDEKIEGFWAACQEIDPERDVGVILPASNVRHLMLRRPVTDAIERGQLSIWPVEHVDAALEILTGLEASKVDMLVEEHLDTLRENLKGSGAPGESMVLIPQQMRDLPAGPPDPTPKT